MLTLICVLVSIAAGAASAGPPLLSDDPGTIGRGRVEAIVAVQVGSQGGSSLVDGPVLDLTIGVAKQLDFTLVGSPSFLVGSEDGPVTSGNIEAGLKWQPFAGERFAASFTPSIGVNVLSIEEFFFYLPLQVEYRLPRGAIGADGGIRLVRNAPDGWNASVYGVLDLTPRVAVMAEVWARDAPAVQGADFGTGVGVDWTLRSGLSLLGMIGTGIGSTDGPRIEWVGYCGIRWAFGAFGAGRGGPL